MINNILILTLTILSAFSSFGCTLHAMFRGAGAGAGTASSAQRATSPTRQPTAAVETKRTQAETKASHQAMPGAAKELKARAHAQKRQLTAEEQAALNQQLFDAIDSGSEEKVTNLLDAGADIEARNERHYTPLILAAQYNAVAIARALIQKGANIDSHDNARRVPTPLVLASLVGSSEIVKLLIDAGADINKIVGGVNALNHALTRDPFNHKVIELLLDAGIDTQLKYSGITPSEAAKRDPVILAKILTKQKAKS